MKISAKATEAPVTMRVPIADDTVQSVHVRMIAESLVAGGVEHETRNLLVLASRGVLTIEENERSSRTKVDGLTVGVDGLALTLACDPDSELDASGIDDGVRTGG